MAMAKAMPLGMYFDFVGKSCGKTARKIPKRAAMMQNHSTLGESWPPFTSHIAFELFKKTSREVLPSQPGAGAPTTATTSSASWFSWLTGGPSSASSAAARKPGPEREPLSVYNEERRKQLEDYYVRVRYNDKVMKVPGCKAAGNNLDGDDSFCTLEAFKTIVDKFTPKDWKSECMRNVSDSAFPGADESAGY